MKKYWLNDKQPDDNGDYILVVENNAGQRVSTFKGKTTDEVLEALAESYVNANRQLARFMKGPDRGRTAPIKADPKQIDDADRIRLASDMTDPERVVEAVEEIVTKRQGVPLPAVGERTARADQSDADAYYKAEAEAFVIAHPEYYPVQQNQVALFRALEAKGWDLTRNNLSLVYQELLEDGILVHWPGDLTPPDEEEPPAAAAPPPAPRSIASGLRNSDASASKPAPPPRKPLITKAELERMSRAEYNERLRDPKFRQAVDALV